MILSAIIHGLIYRAIWGIERGTGAHGAVAIAIAIIGAMLIGHLIMRLFFRRRYRGYGRYRSNGDYNGGRQKPPQNPRNHY
jgi:hypothetical protein